MECKTFNDRISFFIDKEMKPEELKDCEQHLKECGKCREMLLSMEQNENIIREIPLLPLPSTLEIDGKVRTKNSIPSWFSFSPSTLALAFSMILIFIFALNLLISNTDDNGNIPLSSATPSYSRNTSSPTDNLLTVSSLGSPSSASPSAYALALNHKEYEFRIEGEDVRLISLELSDGENSIFLSLDENP